MRRNTIVISILILITVVIVIITSVAESERVRLNTIKANELKAQNFKAYFNLLYENSAYMIFAVDHGEWGASVLFFDKLSGEFYSYNMPLPTRAFITKDGFTVVGENWYGDELYTKKEVFINDPQKLVNLPSDILDLDSISIYTTYSKSALAGITGKIFKYNLEQTKKNFTKEDSLSFYLNEDSIISYSNKSYNFALKQKSFSDQLNVLLKADRKYNLLKWLTENKDSLSSSLSVDDRKLFYSWLDSLSIYSKMNKENWALYINHLSIKDSILSNNANVKVSYYYNNMYE